MTVPIGTISTARVEPSPRRSVLDLAVEVLALDPSASLAKVAAAAGIGRTTLHKQYATRQDLLVAVAHHALAQAEEAVAAAGVGSERDPAAALERLVRDLVPLGAGLAYLFRQPSLDHEPDVQQRLCALEPPIVELIGLGRRAGVLRTDLPEWWFVSTLYAQIYVAWEAVALGRVAPLDAPVLVLATLVDGLGSHRA